MRIPGVCLLAAAAAAGQDPSVFRVETRVVNVTFSAADREGNYLADLSKEEVTLFEDGRNQPIRHFSRESDLPLTLGIVVDLSGSQRGLFRKNRAVALRFLQQVLKKKDDRVFVVTFGSGIRLVQDETNNLEEVGQTFQQWDAATEDALLWSKRSGSPIYTTLLMAVRHKFTSRPGRKAILVISDGEDNGRGASVSDTIEKLQTVDTLAYWMKTPNMQVPPGLAGRLAIRLEARKKIKDMRKIAEETGGRSFEEESLAEQFEKIEHELRTQYSLGFSPARAPDGKTHKLQIRVQRPGSRIRHRPQYRDEPALEAERSR